MRIPESVVDASPILVANGSDEPTASSSSPTVHRVGGQRGPAKTLTMELTGEFDGLWLKVQSNAKRGRLREMEEASSTVRDEIMAELVLDHNLVDAAGEPYPAPLTLAALDDMPLDLYSMVAEAVGQAIVAATQIPKV